MYEYFKGKIVEISPTYVVIEVNQIAFFIHISLSTFTKLSGKEESKIFIHQVIREDAHLLFGFAENEERALFRQLITVSGIGANTGRMMLSSLNAAEIKNAIIRDDINTLKGIKGIGIKTAQRLVIELKDKIIKEIGDETLPQVSPQTASQSEAISALVMLGFNQKSAEKVVGKLSKENTAYSVEDLIKKALNEL